MSRKPRSASIILTLLLLCSIPAASEVIIPQHQAHARMGAVIGSLSGPVSSSFTTVPSFEFDYESFLNQREALLIRSAIAIDSSTSKTRYIFGGVGKRHYFKDTLAYPTVSSNEDTLIQVVPKLRYFWNWDVGISTLLVQEVTSTFDATSTTLESGIGGGAAYRITDKFSAAAHSRISYGYGFSSVSVNAIVMTISFGGTYFF